MMKITDEDMSVKMSKRVGYIRERAPANIILVWARDLVALSKEQVQMPQLASTFRSTVHHRDALSIQAGESTAESGDAPDDEYKVPPTGQN